MKLPDKKEGERVYLAMPRPFESQLSGIERVPAGRSRLVDAIRIESGGLDVECSIRLPGGWKTVTDPFSARERNDIGDAQCVYAGETDGVMRFQSHLLLNGGIVRPDSFGGLRSLLLVYGQDRIVLEKE